MIDPIHIAEVIRIPDKGSMGQRQPPPRRQPQPRPTPTPTPTIPLYRPDGIIDGVAETDEVPHIDLVG